MEFILILTSLLLIVAVCEVEDHAAWCRCLPGFVKGPNDACISLCLGVPCASNAYCAPASEGVTCKCHEGFAGNPFPGGQCIPEVCATTHSCQEPMVCVSGRCKDKCGDALCGIGAKCDRNSNRCVCPDFFVGNPKYKCVARKFKLVYPRYTKLLCTNFNNWYFA